MYIAATRNSTGDLGAGVEAPGFFSGRFWRFDDRIDEPWLQAHLKSHVKQLFLPPNVDVLNTRPSVAQYEDRLYIVGGHSGNVVVDEFDRVLSQGILPPNHPPTISGAAGTGTFAYTSFWDELTDEHSPLSAALEIGAGTPRVWSDLPTAVPGEVQFTALGANITSASVMSIPTYYARPGDKLFDGSTAVALLRYPTTSNNWTGVNYTTGTISDIRVRPLSRASHVCLWLSMLGGLPRLAAKVRLGTTTVTESLSSLQLGEAHPGDFEAMPTGAVNTVYHQRQLVAGDPYALDTVYLSAIGFPERYEGLQFRTKNGEEITSLIGTRDYCLVMTARSTYIIQGYTEDDLKMDVVDPETGSVGHSCNTLVHGTPYITSRTGIYLFNGAWHPVMRHSSGVFTRHYSKFYYPTSDNDNYAHGSRANSIFYKTGQLVHNPTDSTIQLFMGYRHAVYPSLGNIKWFTPESVEPLTPDYGTYAWVLDYTSVESKAGGGFSEAQLVFDVLNADAVGENDGPGETRRYTAAAFLQSRLGNAALWFGDNSGYLLKEDEEEPLDGSSVVLPAHDFFGQSIGTERDGKTLVRLWSNVESETTEWSVYVTGGDEWAGVGMAAFSTWVKIDPSHSLPMSQWGMVRQWPWMLSMLTPNPLPRALFSHTVVGNFYSYYPPQTFHSHPVTGVSGRGFSFLWLVSNPINWTFRGYGGFWIPGPTTRGILGYPPSS